MHIEIHVALNFVISYLYNKLPRRRVNIFGEELEKALKERFQGHWYPEKPFKGSAFRCLKTGEPTDAVLDRAARESGVPIADILENLPSELAVWVDPGEVSYRVGEKGAVKILYSEMNSVHDDHSADREVTKTFNPEAPCFRPIDTVSKSLGALSLSPKRTPHVSPSNNGLGLGLGPAVQCNGVAGLPHGGNGGGAVGGLSPTGGNNNHNIGPPSFGNQQQHQQQQQQQQQHHQHQQHQQQHQQHQQQQQQQQQSHQHHHHHHSKSSAGGHIPMANGNGNGNGNNANLVNGNGKPMGATSPAAATACTSAFLPRTQTQLTFTTATFAQTKFGSTKLKTSSKRANSNMLTALSMPRSRMSPTEFSNYIKQRAMQQQHIGGGGHPHAHGGPPPPHVNGLSMGGLNQLGSVSPSRSVSPNPLASAVLAAHSPDPYYFGGGGVGVGGGNSNGGAASNHSPMSLYPPPFGGVGRNMYGLNDVGLFGSGMQHNNTNNNGMNNKATAVAATVTAATSSNYRDPHSGFGGVGGVGSSVFGGLPNAGSIGNNGGPGVGLLGSSVGLSAPPLATGSAVGAANGGGGVGGGGGSGQQSSSSGDSSPASGSSSSASTAAAATADGTKLMDGLSAFYTNAGPYQHLLVAN